MNESQTDYATWTKEELINKIRKLECHVKQLRNVISKRDETFSNPRKRQKCHDDDDNIHSIGNVDDDMSNSAIVSLPHNKEKKQKPPRKFDFTTVSWRHVALKFLYLGWDYQGLAVQEDTNETIEAHLFKALTLTRLIEDRTKSNYHRCGRTDKGVSAFCQVISIDLRSKVVDGEETLDYCKMLNKTLPRDIRVIGWSPVRSDFSARFDCRRRTYKYFFPRGDISIENMLTAAQSLIGEHDFRNFCKIDKEKRTTIRKILSVEILHDEKNEYGVCHIVIVGESFIWHQIRCIVGVLLLIGKGLEDPGIVSEMLNVQNNPQKPQYTMAVDYPLVLYNVEYPEVEGIKWTYTPQNMTALLADLQTTWTDYAIKAEMTNRMLSDIEKCTEVKPENGLIDSLIMGTKKRVYVKLLNRPTCGSGNQN